MKRVILLILVVCSSWGVTALSQNDRKQLESELSSQLKDKIVFIRGFYRGTHLKYDSTGELSDKPERGVCTFDGRMLIKEIKVGKHDCVLKGERLGTIFDYTKKEMRLSKSYGSEIEIALDERNAREALLAAMPKIFMNLREKLADMVPAYWHYFLEHPFAEKPAEGTDPSGARIFGTKDEQRAGWKEAAPMGVREGKAGGTTRQDPDYYTEDGTPVFRASGQSTPMFYAVGKKITAPRVIEHVDPEYPELMRQTHAQGTGLYWAIVGANGRIQELQVMRPWGMGLDEAGAEAIRKWKFEPAKLDGRPVAVRINIEVNFRLFQ